MSMVQETMVMFRRSLHPRLLWFALADAGLLIFLFILPSLLWYVSVSDPAFQFARDNTMGTVTPEMIPDSLVSSMVLYLVKLGLLLLVFVAALFAYLVFVQVAAWNMFLGRKHLFAGWRFYGKALLSWFFGVLVPFVVILLGYGLLAAAIGTLLDFTVVKIVLFAVAWYGVLWFSYASVVMHRAAFSTKRLGECFAVAYEHGKRFHIHAAWFVLMFVLVSAISSLVAYRFFSLPDVVFYVNVGLAALYLAWMKGYVGVMFASFKSS